MIARITSALLFLAAASLRAQTYTNPVLFADYSDPDAIRSGSDYYLVASSFHFSPGLPILHSRDLVHWELAGHALPRLALGPAYNMQGAMRYAGGVWAPALRQHAGLFYLYFPTPDEGIFVVTAPTMHGPWSAPVAVIAQPGLEDPCPFWDDDGKAYLVHSRKGAGPLILHRMAPDGKSVLDEGKVIVDDPVNLHTLEGPKFYKRNGWYYLFAPMGGVGTGAQAVLRSRSIDGPYEHRIVLAQGSTAVNGPHQGAYVETPEGKGWFLHFQQRGAHGRIVHLEPVRWEEDWPIIGAAAPGATAGQPVASGPVPVPGQPAYTVATSDEFSSAKLSAQWEWNHNPDDGHWSLNARKGYLRLTPGYAADLLHARNTLTEMMQDENFEFTTELDVSHLSPGTHAGLSFFDKTLNSLAIVQRPSGRVLVFTNGSQQTEADAMQQNTIQLRIRYENDQVAYSYSLDRGKSFQPLGTAAKPVFSWWKGARPALFAYTTDQASSGAGGKPGYADFDWAHYHALPGSAR